MATSLHHNSFGSHRDNDLSNADELNLRGDWFLNEFETTGDFEDVCQAIEAYEQAAACLSADDPRLGAFLNDIAIGYEARYERFGWLGDLDKAIAKREKAVAVTVEGDANLPRRLHNLGASLSLRFEHTGHLDDISKTIRNQQLSVHLTLEGDADLPGHLSDLGNSFFSRFGHSGDLEDISEAIQHQQRAIQLTPDGHADLPGRLSNLGNSYSSRFDHTGNLEDISEAIRNQQLAVQLTPDGHANLPGQLNNLGTSFTSRFERSGDLEDISEAIRNQQLAVQLTPEGHVNLPGRLCNLGKSLSCRFKHTGNLDDISEAIRNQQCAVHLTPDGHPNLPTWVNNLGSSLSSRFGHTGDLEDISDAIRNQQLAVQLTPEGHANLPTWFNSLGSSFFSRFEHTGDLEDISEAIRNHQHAVQLTPDGRANLPDQLSNLGSSFLLRFRRTGDLEDISEAIRNQQLAVQLAPDGHADLPAWFNNLGISFFVRFEHTGDLEDISEAIRNQRRAVQLTPNGHSNLPGRLSNLGSSFASRFEHTGDLEDISEAIRNHQLAVQLTSDRHANLPCRLSNLGNSFSSRFECTGNPDDISEAIRNQQLSVQLTPDGHADLPAWFNNLGNSYLSRFKHTENLDDVSEAIRNHQRAVQLTPDGHAVLPGRLSNLGSAFAHHFKCTGAHISLSTAVLNYRLSATSRTGPPSVRLIAARSWVTLLSQQSPLPSELLEAHACIIRLLSLISGLENTVQRRHQILAQSSQLSIAACAAALSLGHPEKALEWLVEGRCIVWNQINQLRTPVDELRSYDPALAESLSILSSKLENAGLRRGSRGKQTELSIDDEISLEDEARMHVKHAKDWEKLVDRIRNIPQFRDFLRPKKCVDVMSHLPEEGPVVIINIHSDRCDALALVAGAGKPLHIPLPTFSYQEAEHLANSLRGYLVSFGGQSRLGIPFDLPHSDFGVDFPAILKALWSDVVSLILDALSLSVPTSDTKMSRIWWCPTGPLAFLPIHAAGIYEQGNGLPGNFLSEFAVSSYIPTVSVREASNSVDSCHDVPTGLLMVSQPNTPGMAKIPFARDEVERIKKQLGVRGIPSCTLDDENATVNHVLESMEKYPCVHLACHASQHTETPLKSSIHLHDGRLELSEIMKKNLHNSDFAFLSACQTSKGDAKLPEEVVHLASGMLAAGYRSVVGTMWSVFDEHCPDLAEYFYESLLEDTTNEGSKIVDGSQAARALHNATKRLRENVSSSPYSFLAWVPYIHITTC